MGNSSQTVEQKIPEWQTALATGAMAPLARRVARQTYTPYTGQTAADLSKYTTNAADIYSGIGSMTPADYAAMNQANMSAYTQNVMDPALARMKQERAKQMAQEQAYIAGSGAFGNERRGVFEGESSANYALGRDAMIADLMRQGYSEAQAATMSQLANRQAGAAGLTGIGGMDTALQQTALDRALEDYRYAYEDPSRRLAAVTGAVQGNYGQTQTETQKRGLFDYLSAAANAGATYAALSDIRLKKDIAPAGKLNGVQFYTWEWNEDGSRLSDPSQPKFGVIAQEVQKTHPHHVIEGDDGYLRVNYVELVKDLAA